MSICIAGLDYKIEISMQPDQDMPNRPYFWRLLKQNNNKSWVGVGHGYSKTPDAAFCKAQCVYESLITNDACAICGGTGYTQIAPGIRGIKPRPRCKAKGED